MLVNGIPLIINGLGDVEATQSLQLSVAVAFVDY